MSDADEGHMPPKAAITRKLRDIVKALSASGDTDNLTIKRVRARAEDELGLESGYLKADKQWKQKSQDIIHQAVDEYGDEAEPEPAPAPPAKKAKTKAAPKASRGVKRAAPSPAKKPQKKRRTVESESEPEASPSDADSEPPQKPAPRRKKTVVSDEEDIEEDGATTKGVAEQDGSEDDDDEGAASASPSQPTTHADQSDSEMSVLIDDEPAPKRKGQKKTAEKPGKSKATAAKPKAKATKAAKDDDPDTAEMKRLQGWLVKCGIRKVWSKELAKYDTSKEKIKHLKAMLKDAGMDGKPSNEKAATIKEQREFAQDLEAIQEGAKHWGQGDEPSTGARGRPTRRAAVRAPVRVAPIDSDDSEAGEGEAHGKKASEGTAGQAKADSDDDMDDGDDDDDDPDIVMDDEGSDDDASASGSDGSGSEE